jgi:GTPase KRas protein
VFVFFFGHTRITVDTCQFCRSVFPEIHDPTMEDEYQKKALIDGQLYDMTLLDTTGLEKDNAPWDQWVRPNQAFILVFSTSSRNTFSCMKDLYHQIRKVKTSPGVGQHEYSVTLVGSKSDLQEERQVSKKEGLRLARELNCKYVEASAKNGNNVSEVIESAVRSLQSTLSPCGTGERAKEASGDVGARQKQRGCLTFVQWPMRYLSFLVKWKSLH